MLKRIWGNGWISRGVQLGSYLFRQFRLTRSHYSDLYWRISPKVYNRYEKRDVDNPFQIQWKNPDHINRWSGRKKAYKNRWETVGTIEDGDWDTMLPNDRPEWLNDLLFYERFEQSTFYQSFINHYLNNVPWRDTQLVNKIIEWTKKGHSYHSCENPAEVYDHFEKIDKVYESIKQNGYKTQKELQKSSSTQSKISLKDAIRNEICVDISRKGKMLLVDGKHRLAISKVLSLDKIPVIVLVQHSNYN